MATLWAYFGGCLQLSHLAASCIYFCLSCRDLGGGDYVSLLAMSATELQPLPWILIHADVSC